MPATNSFFNWFYYGLGNLGGWFLFFLVALAAVVWLFYDSASRRLPALGWRLGISLAAFLILPAALYRFTVNNVTDVVSSPLGPFGEPIFYLGVLGGILPLVLAIGYYVTYQGLVVCPQGHVYEASKGKCPHPSHQQHLPTPPPPVRPVTKPRKQEPVAEETELPARPLKKHLNAWLITTDGRRNYQLYVEETKIGRSPSSDIVLEGDKSVSRESARIMEQNGRFRLYPVNPGVYPRLNSNVVRQPTLLEPDDEIQFGEDTTLRFVTSR